ncbi:hypothetical protein [Pseudomonas sp. Z4-20]|uniref:hypothetical protein n=1 Tax=Pseudomonas sp. Z4-20 TaxID=2817414 RepID=UPI003DAA2235
MKHLSDATVREIIFLSEARLAAIPKDQTQDQILESILGEPSSEEQALRDALSKLSHAQALHLVAMMYTGQYMLENEPYENNEDDGEGMEEQLPMEKFEDVYKDHLRNFQHHDVETLTSMCEQKTNVLHRYLETALKHC